MNIEKKIRFFKNFGYVVLGNEFFSNEDIQKLAEICRKTYKEKKDINHEDCTSKDGGFEGLRFINQHNTYIHKKLDEFFSNKEIDLFLNNILGENYKIWTINYRIAAQNDRGLSLHQDSYGETNLSILLEDNLIGRGSTNFIPGSHLINTSLKIKIPLIFNKLIKPFYKILTGKRGQVSLFFNKTWHGRVSNNSKKNYDAILISLFPPGSSFGSIESGSWNENYLKKYSNSKLIKIIHPEINTTKIDKNTFKVIENLNNKSFTKKLYDKQIKNYSFVYFKSIFLIFFLFLLSVLANPLKKIIRK